jgi:hypothetical protein
MHTRIRFGLLAAVLSLVAACGGGGGGGSNNNTPPPGGNQPPPAPVPAPTAEDNANARSSQLKLSLRADTRELTITWTDTFSAETGYTVEAQSAGGAWQTLESLPAGQATGTPYEWKRVIDASRTYRISATRSGYSVPLVLEGGQTEILVDLPAASMTIEVDQTPPVRGTVQLSVANAVDVQAVRYFVDLATIAGSSTGPTFPVSWNTGGVTDGEHLLIARVQRSSGATVELRRQIVVDNPSVAISLQVAFTQLTRCCVSMSGSVTADAGLQQIEFFVNGASIHVITNPPSGYYQHRFDKTPLPGGTNVFRVVATDTTGATAEATAQLVMDRAPVITMTPVDGTIVSSNNLRIEGTVTDDVSDVSMTISLGSIQLYQTSTGGAFGFDYSLAGLPAGEYTLTASASDAQRNVQVVHNRVIVPPSQLNYELVASGVYEVLATEQGAVLYRRINGNPILRSAGGVETPLQIPAGLTNMRSWQMSGGRIVMAADGATPSANTHVYTFAADGQPINLSQPHGSSINRDPVLKNPWVVWAREIGGGAYDFQIHDLDNDQTTTVAPPVGSSGIVFAGFDLVSTPGAQQLFFSARTGDSIYDVFRYDLSTGITDLITGGDGLQLRIWTDNTRLVWVKGPSSNWSEEGQLIVAPVANPSAATVLSPTTRSGFRLRDGLAAWANLASAVSVNDGTNTTVIAPSAASMHFVSDGRVTFLENSRFMVWTSGGGKQLLLNAVPTSLGFHDDGIAFIGTGASSTMQLYRIVLP